MHTFFRKLPFLHRLGQSGPRALRSASAADPAHPSLRCGAETSARGHLQPGSEAGFLLIEVLISAVLVSLIAIATFSGFDSATRASADEHARSQATQLAAQDEERLRGLTTTELARLGNAPTSYEAENGLCVEQSSSIWRYCEGTAFSLKTYAGIVYTINSSANFVNAGKEAFTCESTEATASYIQTTSQVTWSGLGSHSPVSQSSILTSPSTAGVEVKVIEQDEGPVAGATVELTPEAKGSSTYKQVTPASGCVIFGNLTAKEKVTVTVLKKHWLTSSGETEPVKKVTIVAATITPVSFQIAEEGMLEAEFESNGKTTYEVGTETKPVTSDTFVAFSTKLTPSHFYLGGTPSTATTNTFASTAKVTGLYPFTVLHEKKWEPEPYLAYAGDCEEDSLEKAVGSTTLSPKVNIEPGVLSHVKVEVPAVNVKVYQAATEAAAAAEKPSEQLVTKALSVKVTNASCKGASSENVAKVINEHYTAPGLNSKSETTVGLNSEGELEPKFFPYAKSLELCIVAKFGTEEYWKYKSGVIVNTAKAGTSKLKIFMKAAANTKTKGGTAPSC
jgi:type II secretory pathway pseudopilin PulG